MMRTPFILLLLMSSSHASISSSTIDSDAAEIFDLQETLISHSPAVFKRMQSLVCELINSCCPFIKPHLAEYMDVSFTGDSSLVRACVSNRQPQSFINSCPTVRKLATIAHNEDFQQFGNSLTASMSEMQDFSIRVQQPCSSDEAYATMCDRAKRNQIESCERKTLLYVAEHNSDTDYQTYVREAKKYLRLRTDVINRAFSTENLIQTRTLHTTTPVDVETTRSLFLSTTKQSLHASSALAQKPVQVSIILRSFLLSIVFCWK